MSLNQFEWIKDSNGLFAKEVPSQLLQNPLLQKDIWLTQEDLGLEILEHCKILTLNFSNIKPDWLNLLAKLFIITRANLKLSANQISNDVKHIRKFSKFLETKSLNHLKYIDSNIFEEFESWICATGIAEKTIYEHYASLQFLFDTCRIEGWIDINTYWLSQKRKEIARKRKNVSKKINYLPEEVWNQLDYNLFHLPEQHQRIAIIIRTTGLRIGEVLNLPLDCLRKRNQQWRLRLKETEKEHIEDEMPVPLDLVAVIKEQQGYIKEHFVNKYQKLFCGNNCKLKPQPRVMSGDAFNRELNKLAQEYNICSKDGQVWHFTSHQFRRTVATVMTNAGIRDLIIQKYLRHRNPDMQAHYKHLLQEVMGEEYQELTKEKNFVNIEGKVVSTHHPKDAVEEYMRLRLHQITTQQGECHRSNLKKPCPTVNGCWRCGDWMTSEKDLPYLKEDLKRLKDEVEKANKLGMVRVAKEVQKDINYIQIRINTLEEITNDN